MLTLDHDDRCAIWSGSGSARASDGAAATPTCPALPSLSDVFGKDVGRNDPCPCGSGKKFKRCHGR